MNIRLIIPEVNLRPTSRPRACPYCKKKKSTLHRHGIVRKPIKDHKVHTEEVEAHRYKCLSCARTFRHYPTGVTRKEQSKRTVVLAALMYGLGLSCSAASHLLEALGVEVSKITVWRDAQEAGEALGASQAPAGRMRVLGADETVFKVRGREVVVGFVVDGQSGKTLGFEVLFEGDRQAFRKWLEPYAKELGAEVLISEDNDSYGAASIEMGLSHQLVVHSACKEVPKASLGIDLGAQAEEEWGNEDGKYKKKLEEDLGQLRELLEELPEEGEKRIGWLHREYLWARSPRKEQAKKACVGYRMRMLTLELWNKWPKIRLYLRRPELDLDGTNNASERSIGKSKVRYKTMRGYKSIEGMKNGIALTQWLYSGEDEHDLAEEMAA